MWAHESIMDIFGDAQFTCSEKLLAEVKNKWNTMNSANRSQIISDLETAARQKKGDWTGYLVHIIPKRPQRYSTEIKRNVIETDGASFYHIVTGEPNALHDLFEYLCNALNPSSDIASHYREIMGTSLPPRIG